MSSSAEGHPSETEYDEEIRKVRIPKGTKRPKSSKNASYERDIVYDENNRLAGPSESQLPTEEDFAALGYVHQESLVTQSEEEHTFQRKARKDSFFLDVVWPIFEEIGIAVYEDNKEEIHGVVRAQTKKISKGVKSRLRNVSQQFASINKKDSRNSELNSIAKTKVSREEYAYILTSKALAERFAENQQHLLSNLSIGEDLSPEEIEDEIRKILDTHVDDHNLATALHALLGLDQIKPTPTGSAIPMPAGKPSEKMRATPENPKLASKDDREDKTV
ncbi:hypothetical protein [Corynebacterium lubricantis]|uniref:hypothetical protein n=1 Tax=Corynebacterium lubricantis TaxID=541095 RepID=UPI0003611A35|nr:hypothetical protein [Corynebacterium lubricantis]